MKRPLVTIEGVQAAKAYDAKHKPPGRSWQATTDDQAERIIVGWLLYIADLLKENAP
jgi:hypothetical protein